MENEQWKRQDVTVIIARLMGQVEEAQNTPKNHTFADVTDPYYDGYITFAKDLGIFQGHSDVRFGYGEPITVKQFAAVMLRVLGYDPAWDEVEEMAVEVGLVPAGTDFEVAATRGEYFTLIDTTLKTETAEGVPLGVALGLPGYADEEEEPGVANAIESVTAVGASKLQVAFNGEVDASKIAVSVKRGNINVNIKEWKVSDNKQSIVIELASKLTAGEYTVTVTGVAAEPVSATITAENERVAKIEFTSDKAAYGRIKGSDQNKNDIEEPDVADTSKVIAYYKVYNQYGEDVTQASFSGLQFTAAKGNIGGTAGQLELSGPTFSLNERVLVTIIHPSTNTFASAELTVAPMAQVHTVQVIGLHNDDSSKKPIAGQAATGFSIIVEAKDQYGNVVTDNDILENDLYVTVSDTTKLSLVKVPGYDVVDFSNVPVDGKNKTAVKLDGTFGTKGSVVVKFLSKFSGNNDSITIEIAEPQTVTSLSLIAPDLAVAGERVEIPFEAYDQDGNVVTKASVINGSLLGDLTVNGPSGIINTAGFEDDAVANKAKLYVDARGVSINTPQTVTVTGVMKTGQVLQLSFTLMPNAKPEVVSGLKDFDRAFAQGADANLKVSNLTVLDQYGRTYDIASKLGTTIGTYMIKVASGNESIIELDGTDASPREITSKDDFVKFFGQGKGSTTITISLVDNSTNTELTNSAFAFTARVVDKEAITSYEVDDLKTMFFIENGSDYEANAADYGQSVVVRGVLSDGTKVVIPKSSYTVTSAVYYDSTSGKLIAVENQMTNAPNSAKPDPGKEATVPVVVTVQGASGQVIISKQLTIANVDPQAAKIEFNASGTLRSGPPAFTFTKVSDGVIAITADYFTTNPEIEEIISAALSVRDQYGVKMTLFGGTTGVFNNPGTVIGTAKIAADGREKSITQDSDLQGLVTGDTINFVVVTNNGIPQNLKVIVN